MYNDQNPEWDEEEEEEETPRAMGRIPSPEEKEQAKERLHKCFVDPDYQTAGGSAKIKLIADATGISETFIRSVWANYKKRVKKEAEDKVASKEVEVGYMEREASIAQREAAAKQRMANVNGGFGGDMLMYMNQMEQNRLAAAKIDADAKAAQAKLDQERWMKDQEWRRSDAEKQQGIMMGFMNDERQRAHDLELARMEQGGGGQAKGGSGMFMETGDPEVDAMLKQRQLDGMFGTGWGPALRDAMRPGGAIEMGMKALQGGQQVQEQYQQAQENRFNPGYNPYQQPPPQLPQPGVPPNGAPPYSAYQNQGLPPPPTPPQEPTVAVLSREEYENAIFNHFRPDWPADHLNVLQDQTEITVRDIMDRNPTITDGMDLLDKMGHQLVVVQKLRDLSQGLYAIFDGNLTPERAIALIRTDETVTEWLNSMSDASEVYRIAELYADTGAVGQEWEFLSQGPVRDLLEQMIEVWHNRKSAESIVVASTPIGNDTGGEATT